MPIIYPKRLESEEVNKMIIDSISVMSNVTLITNKDHYLHFELWSFFGEINDIELHVKNDIKRIHIRIASRIVGRFSKYNFRRNYAF